MTWKEHIKGIRSCNTAEFIVKHEAMGKMLEKTYKKI
jgi:hypothetical protein